MSTEGGWFHWAWERREEILQLLERLKKWFRGEEEPKPNRDILILGAGGVGKTTLARFLLEPTLLPFQQLQGYSPSIQVESYALPDDPLTTLIVPPGQSRRRVATWGELLEDLRAKAYRGVVIVGAYGHHHFEGRDYQKHPLYLNEKKAFLKKLIQSQLDEELAILARILEAIEGQTHRTWILSVVTKADLWWHEHASVESYYHNGPYHAQFATLSSELKRGTVRHEVAMASLVIQNWRTIGGQQLVPNTEGFDQPLQIELLRQLVEKLDGLREWEMES